MSSTPSVQPSSTFSPTDTSQDTEAFSSPLILAFLAIGLFSVAMTFIFWRRIQENSGWRLTVFDDINRSFFDLPIIDVDHIPKLWDLSNAGSFNRDKGGVDTEVDVKWANVMPLSTKKVSHSSAANGSTEPRRLPLIHTIVNLNPLSHRRLPPYHDDGKHKSDEEGIRATMQVAVTIALPSPRYPRDRNKDSRQEEGENTDRENMTDYCIGMYECPWP